MALGEIDKSCFGFSGPCLLKGTILTSLQMVVDMTTVYWFLLNAEFTPDRKLMLTTARMMHDTARQYDSETAISFD